MQEVGIDLSAAKPQKLTHELANDASLLITMGCGDRCHYVPGLRRDDWPLRDPKGLPTEEVQLIRDDVKARVQHLVELEKIEITRCDLQHFPCSNIRRTSSSPKEILPDDDRARSEQRRAP